MAELPFGQERLGRRLNAIVKDWSLNGDLQRLHRDARSPSPPPAPRSTRRGTLSTPTSWGPPTRLGGIGADTPYYDTSAWAPVTEVRPGNTGRNSVRGPGWWNIDLSLFRRFPIGKKVNLEARVEAFNLTNTPHFSNPNGSVNSGGS